MNIVCLSGNICRDIELRQTSGGKEVVSNTIAVQREFKNAQGEYESDFISFVVWGASAKYLSTHASKGDRIELVGRWSVRSYEENGVKKYVNECVADKVKVFSSKKKQEIEELPVIEDDDLPF